MTTPDAPDTGDYEALRQRVVDSLETLQGGDTEHSLDAAEVYKLGQTASQGILGQLQSSGVGEAGTLAIDLAKVIAEDKTADLTTTLANQYEQTQKERAGDPNAQAQYDRMAHLSQAAGGTALVIVTSIIRPEAVKPLAEHVREAIRQYQGLAHSGTGAALLESLLEQAEKAVEAEQSGESDA